MTAQRFAEMLRQKVKVIRIPEPPYAMAVITTTDLEDTLNKYERLGK